MSRHPPIFIVHSANLWGMMRRIVGLMTSCIKGQGMHIESRRITKENNAYFNYPRRGNLNPCGGFKGRGGGGGIGRGRGHIICYNCAHLGHLARDCQNPCCNLFEHVIEDCLVLLTKL
jgi:hypothetical protein